MVFFIYTYIQMHAFLHINMSSVELGQNIYTVYTLDKFPIEAIYWK